MELKSERFEPAQFRSLECTMPDEYSPVQEENLLDILSRVTSEIQVGNRREYEIVSVLEL